MSTESDRRRLAVKLEERRRWAEYDRTYRRCLAIAEDVWAERLDAAQQAQQKLAEEMRDRQRPRGIDVLDAVAIPVPLFTPRDRLEFLGRATTNLMIGTEKRGLTVTPELKDAPKEPEAGEAPAIEAASGVAEVADAEAAALAEAGPA